MIVASPAMKSTNIAVMSRSVPGGALRNSFHTKTFHAVATIVALWPRP